MATWNCIFGVLNVVFSSIPECLLRSIRTREPVIIMRIELGNLVKLSRSHDVVRNDNRSIGNCGSSRINVRDSAEGQIFTQGVPGCVELRIGQQLAANFRRPSESLYDQSLLPQTEALRKDRDASEELIKAERAAKYAAEEESVELGKEIETLNNSLTQERFATLEGLLDSR